MNDGSENKNQLQIPPGMRLVSEDDYKNKSSAALDLKKLRELENSWGISASQVAEHLEELGKLKERNVEELQKENQRLKNKVEKLEESNKTVATQNKQMMLRQKLGETMKAKGVEVLPQFVDENSLFALDPDSGDIDTQIQQVVDSSVEKQNAGLKQLGIDPEKMQGMKPPLINPNASATPGSHLVNNGDNRVVEALNESVELVNSIGVGGMLARQVDSRKDGK